MLYKLNNQTMKKSLFVSLFALTAFLPQAAFAHFEMPHEAFWFKPMHFIVNHYIGLMLMGVGIVGIILSLRKKSENKREKTK